MTVSFGVDSPLLARIPQTARIVLEIGAKDASIARAFHSLNPQAAYWAVCASDAIARSLQGEVDLAFVDDHASGDLDAAISQALDGRLFDAVIVVDPDQIARSRACFSSRSAPEAVWLTTFPNAGRAGAVVARLLGLDEVGAGASKTAASDAISGVGLIIVDVVGFGSKQKAEDVEALLDVAVASGADAEQARERLMSEGWLVRACQTMPIPLTVVALGLKKMAGVTEARVDYPLQALASLPGVTAAWGGGSVSFPKRAEPGIFLLHRQFLNDEPMISTVERMVSKGWVVVSDMDDDPHHWHEYVESDFRAFRGVHAVMVSTTEMAKMIGQWTPEVTVFPNHLPHLTEAPSLTPKSQGRLRVFFGALNRAGDWARVLDALSAAVVRHSDQIELVVVHDQAFFDALPAGVVKSFHPTLSHPAYTAVLASCDIALLPLSDTPFNRLKSDLKLIECAGAGVVPICSRLVYDEEPEHHEFAVFANSPSEWTSSLIGLLADLGELRRRRNLGLDYVRRRRLHSGHVADRRTYFLDLIGRREELERRRQERIAALSPI